MSTFQTPASPLLPKFMRKTSSMRQGANRYTVCLKYPQSAYKAVLMLPSDKSPTLRINIESQSFSYPCDDPALLLIPSYDSKGALTCITLSTETDSMKFFKTRPEGNQLDEVFSALSNFFSIKGFTDYFKSLKRLGRGGFASVYLVQHKLTKAKYAAKVFTKASSSDQSEDARMLHNEVRIMKDLNHHPNLIRLHGLYETECLLYVVMDYLEGGSLEEIVRTGSSSLKASEILSMLRCVLQGLLFLDSRNIMHRDLNPSNIMLRERENRNDWVVADFGLAAYSDKVYMFPKCGTAGYIAPEILKCPKQQSYKQACDIFSLGVILAELVLRRKPFPVPLEELHAQGLDFKEFELAEHEKAILHPSACRLLTGMLALDPAKRLKLRECMDSEVLSDKTGNVGRTIDNLIEYVRKDTISKLLNNKGLDSEFERVKL